MAAIAAGLLVGCAESGMRGVYGVEIHDGQVACDDKTGECIDVDGELASGERQSGAAFVSQLASANADGVYLYLELVRQSGARALLELDVPRFEGRGQPHALYAEYRGDRQVFRGGDVRGLIELTPAGCDCQGGRFELEVEGTDADGARQLRRLSRGIFARAGGFCHVSRTAAVGAGLTLRLLSCPGQSTGGRPRPSSGGAPVRHDPYYYPYPPGEIEVGCGVEEAPDDGYDDGDYYHEEYDDGGCGGEEPDDGYDDGGCGDDGSYDEAGDTGCEGDSGDTGCEGGDGCDGGETSCSGDAYASVGPRCRRAGARSCRARPRRRRAVFGVTLPVILPGLLLATFVRRRQRRRRGEGPATR